VPSRPTHFGAAGQTVQGKFNASISLPVFVTPFVPAHQHIMRLEYSVRLLCATHSSDTVAGTLSGRVVSTRDCAPIEGVKAPLPLLLRQKQLGRDGSVIA
jgi:hypothetical protein